MQLLSSQVTEIQAKVGTEQRMKVSLEQEREAPARQLAEKEQQVSVPQAQLAQQDGMIAPLREQVAERDRAVQQLEGEMGQLRAHLDSVSHLKSWRLIAPLRRIPSGIRILVREGPRGVWRKLEERRRIRKDLALIRTFDLRYGRREGHLPSLSGKAAGRGKEVTIWKVGVFLRFVLSHPREALRLSRLAWLILRQEGVRSLVTTISRFLLYQKEKENRQADLNYWKWVARYDSLTDEDRRLIREHLARLPYKPLISVIMPTYNTLERWLRQAIESVQRQLYPHWELCIADDASSEPHVRRVLTEYQEQDPRIKVVFRETRGHISAASNSALALATGEFIALLDHDDEIPEHALYMVAVELNAYPDADIIYSDEDMIDEEGQRLNPYFKPDWNPDLLLAQNYISHLGVYRTTLVRAVGGFREGYEGAQDWDLALRIAEKMPSSHIRHIPFILYHWRIVSGSAARGLQEKPYAVTAQRKTLESYCERIGVKPELELHGVHWRVKYALPDRSPLVSLIISTHNRFKFLSCCIASIFQKTTYPYYEILIVNHDSDDPETLQYLDLLAQNNQIRILPYHGPFNYSTINNMAARFAQGDVIGFLNNDVEVISPEWLSEMVSHALRPEVGAVGAMLYYPNDTIQHAGVILGISGVAGHAYRNAPRWFPGQQGRARLVQNLSAVTGACLVLRREVFKEVGGFNEALATAYNDVDLCLRIRERGYRIVWTPFAELYHHEGVSRGRDTLKSPYFRQAVAYMQQRWGELLLQDPAYNPNLTLAQEDFSLAFPPRVKKPWRP